MTIEAKRVLQDILADPNVEDPIKDAIKVAARSFIPTDSELVTIQANIKDTSLDLNTRRQAIAALITKIREADPVP